MLTLSRRVNERMRLRFLDQEQKLIDIWIEVVGFDVRGEKVRLGIEAPLDVVILREELIFPRETE